jgi:hypothetical protein
LLALQARAQDDQAAAAHKAQIEHLKAQNDTIHQQVKAHAEIELAKIKAELDAKMKVLDAHLKAAAEQQKMQHAQAHHEMAVADAALGMVAAAAGHEARTQQQCQGEPV